MASGVNACDLDRTQVSADILLEFLEVAIHSILYARLIYPRGVFQRRRKYNVPVQMSCHPDVTRYITDTVQSLAPLLHKQTLRHLAVVILDTLGKPIERFIFEIAPPLKSATRDDTYLMRLEQALRAFLLKLNICDALLADIPKESRWCVQVSTTEAAYEELQGAARCNDFTWVEADPQHTHLPDPTIMPLKSTENNIFRMQLYVEEKSSGKMPP